MGSGIRELSGELYLHQARVGLVAARYNAFVVERLLAGAVDGLRRSGLADDALTIARVPGALELPLALQRLAASQAFDGLIALGAVVRGATAHFDVVVTESARGIAQVAMSSGIPVANAVLTTETVDQAIERAGSKAGNKGFEAAQSLVEMINLIRRIESGA